MVVFVEVVLVSDVYPNWNVPNVRKCASMLN